MSKIIKTWSDGGSRGNPGPAAYGVVLKDEAGKIVKFYHEYIGINTNNQAEYGGLIKSLELAHELGADEVHCHLDSELIVKQMRQEYKVKDPGLSILFVKAWNWKLKFKKITFTHIRREFNSEADALVNEALDEAARS